MAVPILPFYFLFLFCLVVLICTAQRSATCVIARCAFTRYMRAVYPFVANDTKDIICLHLSILRFTSSAVAYFRTDKRSTTNILKHWELPL